MSDSPSAHLVPSEDPNAVDILEHVLAKPLPDGYWIHAFPYSTTDEPPHGHPDVIAYGLGFEGKPATVRLFTNPLNDTSKPGPPEKGWKVSEIAYLEFPVAMAYADLTGNKYNDVIICDRYGPSMDKLWDADSEKKGGRIQWLLNPADRTSQPYWKAHTIGHLTGMHRLEACHFTTKDVVQVVAFPIIHKSSDLTSPAPVVAFTPKYANEDDKSAGPKSWHKHVAYLEQFRLIHDVKVLRRTNGDLDMLLVSGKEGVVLLWYDVNDKRFMSNVVGTGIPDPKSEKVKYWGAGSVDVCRVGDDDVGYIATCEAFHGNIVAVYTKSPKAPKGAESLKDSSLWARHVIEDYGPLDTKSQTGTLHHVASVPFAREIVPADSFAVACMGVPIGKSANQGVYMYKPVHLEKALFEKIKITGESAGRLAVGSFSGCASRQTDIASTSYYVPGYHTGPDPPNVRIDSLRTKNTVITAAKIDKEVMLRIPRPSALEPGQMPELPFWDLAGKRLSLAILAPNDTTKLDPKFGAIKVIYGNLTIKDFPQHGQSELRCVAPPAHTVHTTNIHPSSHVAAGQDGAVYILVQILHDSKQGPFSTMSQVISSNGLPNKDGIDEAARGIELPFVRVDKTDWGISGRLWNDFQFFNVTGFHVYFNDDSLEKVVHIQAWTLGLSETARFHNHTDKSFCEIHYCLTNGGGKGGMRYFLDNYTDPIDVDKELTKEYVEKNSTLLVVPPMHEHGPLWRIKEGTKATPVIRDNDTVSYPWHAWLASEFGDNKLPIKPPLDASKQKYDVWMAFEFPSSSFQY